MELVLTDDQEFFRETTQRFLESQAPIVKVRELRASSDGFERDYWRQGCELGWTAMLVPEELGGGSISGSGLIDLTLVADSFGRHVAPGPLIPSNAVAAALVRSGTDEQRAEVLPAIVGGETVVAWAIAEPAPHDRLGSIEVQARADGDGFVLDGVKSPVEAGAQADQLLVTARTDGGLVQLLVPSDTAGVTVDPLAGIDLVRRFAEIRFDGARVGADALVGAPGGADADVEHQLQVALVLQLAELVGAAEIVFDFTVDWAFNRYSFGRPLASYQALKHRFADMKTWPPATPPSWSAWPSPTSATTSPS
jgi:alkylation response protein AidB-like acyl-CoA dehydrogenase